MSLRVHVIIKHRLSHSVLHLFSLLPQSSTLAPAEVDDEASTSNRPTPGARRRCHFLRATEMRCKRSGRKTSYRLLRPLSARTSSYELNDLIHDVTSSDFRVSTCFHRFPAAGQLM